MISSQVREHICLIARTSPADWKISAFSTRSLTKLAEHLVKQNVVPAVSRETLRRILREGRVSWQTSTTWKSSNDPDFIAKMHRILALYDSRRPTAGWSVWTSSGRSTSCPAKARHGARTAHHVVCGPPTAATTA
ncbi:hypothetical protein [Streptomyces sp. Inha503]|uniref:hypothetical protein n=1 Tax=Streptomyces sp. Inha503 TaxID=3383314 RepID=UPI0039A0E639